MRFLAPLGLLGLLGIVALIVIYLLKPKYQDRTVASSFIWKLSLKYKKKKMPFEWLKSSLLLVLQILVLTFMTIILVRPHYVLATKTGEKIAILDTSASMLVEQNGKTRLDRAIAEIEKLAERTIINEDKFSIILAGEQAELIVNRSTSIEYVKNRLRAVKSDFSTSNIDEAMTLTESIMKANNTAEIIYFTSENYQDPGRVLVRNFSLGEWNVALLNFKGELDQGGNYVFTTQVVSYGRDVAEIVLELKINGQYKTSAPIKDLKAGIPITHVWKLADVNEDTYSIATVSIADIKDDFIYDNELEFYSRTQNFKIQLADHNDPLVADSTKEYITRALQSLKRNYSIKHVSKPEDYATEGYDLYIYSVNVPETLPTDGAIWIFDPKTLPLELGTVEEEVTMDSGKLVGETQSSLYYKLLHLVTPSNITVSKYKKLMPSQNFDVVLSYQNDPMLMVSTNPGVKVSIFSFGMSYSNLPILFLDLPMLVRNLSDYSLIKTIDSNIFDAGKTIKINAHPAAVSMEIIHQDTVTSYKSFPVSLELNQLGSYKIKQTLNSGQTKELTFYVRVPEQESRLDYKGEVILMPMMPDKPGGEESKNDLFDLLPYLAAILLVLVVAEWRIQYREQY